MKSDKVKSLTLILTLLGLLALLYAIVVPFVLEDNFESDLGGVVNLTTRDYTSWGMIPGHLEIDSQYAYKFHNLQNGDAVLKGGSPLTTETNQLNYTKSSIYHSPEYQPDGTFEYKNYVEMTPSSYEDQTSSQSTVTSVNPAAFSLWERTTTLEPWNVFIVNMKQFWDEFYVPQLYSNLMSLYLLQNEYSTAATVTKEIQSAMGVSAATAGSLQADKVIGFGSGEAAAPWILASAGDQKAIHMISEYVGRKYDITREQVIELVKPSGLISQSIRNALAEIDVLLKCPGVCTPQDIAVEQWSLGGILSKGFGGIATFTSFGELVPSSPCDFDWFSYTKGAFPKLPSQDWFLLSFQKTAFGGPYFFEESAVKALFQGTIDDIRTAFSGELLSEAEAQALRGYVKNYFLEECLTAGAEFTSTSQENHHFAKLAAQYAQEVLDQLVNLDILSLIYSVGFTGLLANSTPETLSCSIIYQHDLSVTVNESISLCNLDAMNLTTPEGAWNVIAASQTPNDTTSVGFTAIQNASKLSASTLQNLFAKGSTFMTALVTVMGDFKTAYACKTETCTNHELAFSQWSTSLVTSSWPASLKPSKTFDPGLSLTNIAPAIFPDGPIEYSAIMEMRFPGTPKTTYGLQGDVTTILQNMGNQFQVLRLLQGTLSTQTTPFGFQEKMYPLAYLKHLVEIKYLGGFTHQKPADDFVQGYTDDWVLNVQGMELIEGGVENLNHFVSYGGFLQKEQVSGFAKNAVFGGIKETHRVRSFSRYLGYSTFTVPLLSANNTEVVSTNELWDNAGLIDGTDGMQFKTHISDDDALEQFFPDVYRVLSWKLKEKGISYGDVDVHRYELDEDDWMINHKYGVTQNGYLPLEGITQRKEYITNGDSYVNVQPLFGHAVKKQEQFTYHIAIQPNLFYPLVRPGTMIPFVTRTEMTQIPSHKSNTLFTSYKDLHHDVLVTRLVGYILAGLFLLAALVVEVGRRKEWWGKVPPTGYDDMTAQSCDAGRGGRSLKEDANFLFNSH